MAGIAVLWRALENTALMATFAASNGMRAGQWKAGLTVINLRAAGRALRVCVVNDQATAGKHDQQLHKTQE
jgi:hypothetical protein